MERVPLTVVIIISSVYYIFIESYIESEGFAEVHFSDAPSGFHH